jgi:hypothetical protein
MWVLISSINLSNNAIIWRGGSTLELLKRANMTKEEVNILIKFLQTQQSKELVNNKAQPFALDLIEGLQATYPNNSS